MTDPKGLNNLGNSCFMNSALQLLIHNPPFFEGMLALARERPTDDSRSDVCGIFLDFCRRYSQAVGSFSPKTLFSNLRRISKRLTPGRQHDSHEFLISLLDHIEMGLKKRRLHDRFSKLLGGKLSSQVICGECGGKSKTPEPFTVMSLVKFLYNT